jgi:transposase
MIPINLSAADSEALRYWRFQHPDPRVQGRMEALYLRSQRMADADILRLCGMSKASFHRDLKAYVTGGLEPLKPIDHDRPQRELTPYRSTREASVREHPPATVGEAAAKITELTGIARRPTPVRQFVQALGMKPRTVGMLPAQADVDAQAALTKTVGSPGSRRPRRANAPSGLWMPRMWSWRPVWGLSGAFNACLSTRHLDGNACMS